MYNAHEFSLQKPFYCCRFPCGNDKPTLSFPGPCWFVIPTGNLRHRAKLLKFLQIFWGRCITGESNIIMYNAHEFSLQKPFYCCRFPCGNDKPTMCRKRGYERSLRREGLLFPQQTTALLVCHSHRESATSRQAAQVFADSLRKDNR